MNETCSPAVLRWGLPALLLAAILPRGCGCQELQQDPHQQQCAQPVERLQARLGQTTDPRAALALIETIKCRRLRGRLLRAGVTPHALPELEVRLPRLAPDEAILSFFVEKRRLRRLWARGSVVSELPALDLDPLEALVARCRDQLELGEDLRGGELAELLRAAGRALLDGAERSSVRRLLVLPDGLTRAMPFQALIRDGAPLVTHLELAYAPCLGLFRPPAPLPGPAHVLVPAYGREPRPLAGAAAEAATIKALLGDRAIAHQGQAATPGRLREALATAGALVHFGGHGLADLRPGGGAPQLIFPDGQAAVSAGALTRDPVRASLVVLASCATAEVALFRDGRRLLPAVTLPDALLAAGAARVVAASWTVKDQRSALQMEVFYRELGAAGPAAALARAQRRARAGLDPPHPRFWAFYAVYGGW